MDRITNHAPFSANENKIGCTAFGTHVCCSRLGHCEGCPVNENAWEKLAAYEDTGIPPEIVGLLADQRLRLQKQLQQLQQRIHDQKRDNRRMHAERNLAVKALEALIRNKSAMPCQFCRNAKPGGGCAGAPKDDFSCWACMGVHDGKGGFIDAEHTGRSE